MGMKLNKGRLKERKENAVDSKNENKPKRNILSEESPNSEIFDRELDDVVQPKKKKTLKTIIIYLGVSIVSLLVFLVVVSTLLNKPKTVEVPKTNDTKPVVQTEVELDEDDKENIGKVEETEETDTQEIIKDTESKKKQEAMRKKKIEYTNEYIGISMKTPKQWVTEERTQEKMNKIVEVTKGKKYNVLKNSLKGKTAIPIVTFTTNSDERYDSKATLYMANKGFEKGLIPTELEPKSYKEKVKHQSKLEDKEKPSKNEKPDKVKTVTTYNGKKVKEYTYTFTSYGKKYKGYHLGYKIGKNDFIFNHYSTSDNDSFNKETSDLLKTALSMKSKDVEALKKKKELADKKKKESKEKKAKDTKDSSDVEMDLD